MYPPRSFLTSHINNCVAHQLGSDVYFPRTIIESGKYIILVKTSQFMRNYKRIGDTPFIAFYCSMLES